MKAALIIATLVATSHAASVTCDWKADAAGTGWIAGLTCPDQYDCCTPATGLGGSTIGTGGKGELKEACMEPSTKMMGPVPNEWGTNTPADSICCKRESGFTAEESACNIGLSTGYAGASGNAKPAECPKGSTKCGGDACIIVAAGKYCLRGGEGVKDKLVDNTCDAWYATLKDGTVETIDTVAFGQSVATACGAITWTDATAPTDSCSKTRDDCKYTSYKVGAFTDATKSTNKDAKLICFGITYVQADGTRNGYAPKEDGPLKIQPFGEVRGSPEGEEPDTMSGSTCSRFPESSPWTSCKAPDTTKQGCPGWGYDEAGRKKFYPDGACTCNTYAATDANGASSATSAAMSASAVIGVGAGILALL